jgi:hypothetical protein
MDRAALIAALEAGLLAPERAVIEIEPTLSADNGDADPGRSGDAQGGQRRDPDARTMAA